MKRLSQAMIILAALAMGPVAISTADEESRTQPVAALHEAFNAHDIDRMLETVTEDIGWYTVDGANVTVEVRGRSALRDAMASYFGALPSAHSEIESMQASPPYVVARERAHWESAGGPRSQSSLAVYEVTDGLVSSVWYYPANP